MKKYKQYYPFGNIRSIRGSIADKNPMRFSSRYYEGDTNLYYYSYRHYCPSIKKWLSQDPIGEQGGINLYNFVGNNSIDRIDLLGMVSACSMDIYVKHGSADDSGGDLGQQIKESVREARANMIPPESYGIGGVSCFDAFTNTFSGGYGYLNPKRTMYPRRAIHNPFTGQRK